MMQNRKWNETYDQCSSLHKQKTTHNFPKQQHNIYRNGDRQRVR